LDEKTTLRDASRTALQVPGGTNAMAAIHAMAATRKAV
jgi:hypothetical protein